MFAVRVWCGRDEMKSQDHFPFHDCMIFLRQLRGGEAPKKRLKFGPNGQQKAVLWFGLWHRYFPLSPFPSLPSLASRVQTERHPKRRELFLPSAAAALFRSQQHLGSHRQGKRRYIWGFPLFLFPVSCSNHQKKIYEERFRKRNFFS